MSVAHDVTPEDWRYGLEEVNRADVKELVAVAGRAPYADTNNTLGQVRLRLAADEIRAYHFPGIRGRATTETITMAIIRGDLVDLLLFGATEHSRTYSEQDAMVRLAQKLDGAFRHLEALMAESHATTLHWCECGQLSTRYWCSPACQDREDLGPRGSYGPGDDVA